MKTTHDERGRWERTDAHKNKIRIFHAENRVKKLRDSLEEETKKLSDLYDKQELLEKEAA